jgi:membrane fusion protein, copper/silver efflux system
MEMIMVESSKTWWYKISSESVLKVIFPIFQSFNFLTIFPIFLIFLIFQSCTQNKKEADHIHMSDSVSSENVFYCPMDTQIVQKGPGSCPICGMDLEPKPVTHHHDSLSQDHWVYSPANLSVLSSVKSTKPIIKTVSVKIKVTGYIDYDERKIYSVSAKTAGRIEKLYIKYNYQPVKKGQALFEIYSHDLQTAQQEYLYVKMNDPNAADLIKAAKKKLLLLGMTETQISSISASKHVHATTAVYSPYTGFIIEKQLSKKRFVPASGGSMENTSGMGSSQTMNESKEISLREGTYVDKGERVFKIANTDLVWAIFEVYPNQLNQIKLNQPIHIMLENPEEMIMGKINFIEPSYKEGTGTSRLRVYLDNKDQNLKIGALISGEIEAGEKKGLWIPSSSVYDLGRNRIVFVKRAGAFETKKISIGYASEKEVEVVSGLSEGEEIAENAQFLVDSESFIKIEK